MMKRERLMLSVLGAIFVVELAIGIPALHRASTDDDASVATRPVAAASPIQATTRAQATPPALAVAPPSTRVPVARPTERAKPVRSQRPQSERVSLAAIHHAQRVAVIDDLPDASAAASFSYVGHWEHVRAIEDGRTAGTSSRSYQAAAGATLHFTGSDVRLFGVCGPQGGRALVTIDGRSAGPVANFYAPKKESHMLVYRSPHLQPGAHRLTISVSPAPAATKHRYVNIDGAEVDS